MPKRKAAAKASAAWTGEEAPETNANGSALDPEERPTKRPRGRQAAKSAEEKPSTQTKARVEDAPSDAPEPAPKKKRGRPRGDGGGGRSSPTGAAEQATEKKEEPKGGRGTRQQKAETESKDDTDGSADDLDAPQDNASKSTRTAKTAKPAAARGRKKASMDKQIGSDGGFQYTSTPRKATSPQKSKEQPEEGQQVESEANDTVPENENPAHDVVEESIALEEPRAPRSVSASPSKAAFWRQSNFRASLSPQKRRTLDGAEYGKTNPEPELRRKIGDLTRKNEALENRYRNLREIGIVEANNNMEKLRKQSDAMTTASNNLVNSLKEELEAQRTLGQQTRALQKQLQERDDEIAQFKSQADGSTTQLSSAQSEVKALQTKLSAARNTAASLESAAAKAPGSAIKGGAANRANAAASAEAANAAQFAQLKEDLYSDLTGLIIRDVKKRETDSLYDCIQTGCNGTLHFKLAVPHVSSANFETAEFQYIPLLDENRDRDLVAILPEYLTVDITFARQQASKFYTRVIDMLTKRRSISG